MLWNVLSNDDEADKMKIHKCCNCQSKQIVHTTKDIYCKKCGLVLASTKQYDAGNKTYYPYGLYYG